MKNAIMRAFAAEGLRSQQWTNEAGFVYAEHAHPYRKVLICRAGSITFHLASGDVTLGPGDRLDLDPHTSHAATVGPDGVTCWEATTD